MIPKYSVTLAIAVALVTYAASSLQFATRSQVPRGNAFDETLLFEFTVHADSSHTYRISPAIAQLLGTRISFRTEGPVRVVAAKVAVTPKNVSWTRNRNTITAPGAAMTAQIKWDTPLDSANGAHGYIYLDFPRVPELEGKTADFHSGGYQVDDEGRYVIREVTTYASSFQLSLARFAFALTAGLPLGILLHTICWAFVLKAEKRSRLAALPPEGFGLPRTFYPNPIAEWSAWLLALGIIAVVPTLLAGFSVADGFMSSSFTSFINIFLAISVAIALIVVYFAGKYILTVRVETDGISYARGRGNLQWLHAAWNDIHLLTQKSRTYRGNTTYWMEVEFNDNRKKLKIGQSIEGYAALRDLLMSKTGR